jgi:hypothetical protein
MIDFGFKKIENMVLSKGCSLACPGKRHLLASTLSSYLGVDTDYPHNGYATLATHKLATRHKKAYFLGLRPTGTGSKRI